MRSCTRQLCQSHMRLAAGLSRGGYLGTLPSLFNTEEERFQQRFAALSVLFRPKPLTHAQYCTSMDMTGPVPVSDTSAIASGTSALLLHSMHP